MGRNGTIKISGSAICLALALVLPILTGQIQPTGNMLCPMHLPVLICGFLCGWQWGLVVGLVAPILRSLIFGAPTMFPRAVAMALELAAYGLLAGLCYKLLPKKIPNIYFSLLIAMVGGRAVWGIAQFMFAKILGTQFPLSAFIAGAVTNSLLGIAVQIILVPLIVLALKKAKLIANE